MNFQKLKPVLIILAVLLLIPLTELIPNTLIRSIVQFPLCILCTILFFMQREIYGGKYENIVNKIHKKNEIPTEDLSHTQKQQETLNEISIWKKLGFHLLNVVCIIWIWGGAISSLVMLLSPGMKREASLFISFSILVAGGIVYLAFFSIFLWIFKSRRSKDDYPFLIRPREKTIIIYGIMFFLTIILALIYKKVFRISLVQTVINIVITGVGIILIGPPMVWLRYFIFYNTKRIKDPENYFGSGMAERLKTFCKEKGVRLPFLYEIDDDAPIQAFTYNYGPLLSWVYFSRGMKEALSEKEFETVLKHEVGHIKHWDFLAIAAPAIILSSVFEFFSSGSLLVKEGGGGGMHLLAVGVSIAVINFAIYALQKYLSRTREYYADEFSAEGVGDPDANSSALAKICYGLAGPKNKPHVSVEDMKKAMSWDLKNPWARTMEFLMTHPLTANRTRYMSVLANTIKGGSQFSTASDSIHRYFQFILDVIADWGFSLSLAFSVLLIISIARPVPGLFYIIAGGILLVSTFYKYPFLIFSFQDKKARTLMQDLKASPVRGTPVIVKGSIIGRRSPGARLCAHPVLEDESGFVACDYQLINTQIIPGANDNFWMQYLNPFFIYHLVLGYLKMKEWIKYDEVKILGWFRRMGSSGNLEILKIEFPDGKVYRSYTLYALLGWAIILMAIGGIKMIF